MPDSSLNPQIAAKKRHFVPVSNCQENSESTLDCTRKARGYLNMSTGMPAVKSFLFNSKYWMVSQIQSPYNSISSYSPTHSAGVLPTGTYREAGGISEVPSLSTMWVPAAMADTPLTVIYWERGALDLNVFRVSLARLISGKIYGAFDLSSASMTGQEFTYAPTVHQLFLAGYGTKGIGLDFLSRDSSYMVMGSTSPHVRELHFRPRLGMKLDESKELEVYYDSYGTKTDLNSLVSDSLERVFYDEAIQVNNPSDFTQKTLGGRMLLQYDGFTLNTRLYRGVFEKDVYKGDTGLTVLTLGPSSEFQNFQGEELVSQIELSMPALTLNPALKLSGTRLDLTGPLYLSATDSDTSLTGQNPAPDGWQDNQAAELSMNPAWKYYSGQIFAGVKRFSFMNDERSIQEFYGLENKVHPGFGIELRAGYTRFIREPTWSEKFVYNRSRTQFPNSSLENEIYTSHFSGIDFTHSLVSLGVNFRQLNIDNAVLPGKLPMADSVKMPYYAAGAANYREEERKILGLHGGLNLGNWSAGLEQGILLEDIISDTALTGGSLKGNPTLPEEVIKGTLMWENTFVKNRLRVNVQWNWEWFSERYVWIPSGTDSLSSHRLPDYVALDFTAMMEIRTFKLFVHLKNFYHDRYYVEAGSHPAGINIRWGINWRLKG